MIPSLEIKMEKQSELLILDFGIFTTYHIPRELISKLLYPVRQCKIDKLIVETLTLKTKNNGDRGEN